MVGWLVVWLVAAAAVFKVRIISTGQCSLETDVYKDDKCDVYINNHVYLFSKIEIFANESKLEIPDCVIIQFVLLKMSIVLLETC